MGGTLLSSPEHSLCAYNWLTNRIPSFPRSKHNMCLQHASHRLLPVGMPFLSLPPNLPLNLSAILFRFLSLPPHIQSTKKPGGFQYTSFRLRPQSVQDSQSLLSSQLDLGPSFQRGRLLFPLPSHPPMIALDTAAGVTLLRHKSDHVTLFSKPSKAMVGWKSWSRLARSHPHMPSLLCSVVSHWSLRISRGGSVYTAEIS